MTPSARSMSKPIATSISVTAASPDRARAGARSPLRIGGWANLAIAAAHVVGLIWAWTMFTAVGIEHEMRELAALGAGLPYLLTLMTAAVFVVFGLYALSGAGDLRRLPLLRTALVEVAAIYVSRATLFGGIDAVRDADATQIGFAAIALMIGLCYAYGVTLVSRA